MALPPQPQQPPADAGIPLGAIQKNWRPGDPQWLAQMEKMYPGMVQKLQSQMTEAANRDYLVARPQGSNRADVWNILQQAPWMQKPTPTMGPAGLPQFPGTGADTVQDPYQSPPFNPNGFQGVPNGLPPSWLGSEGMPPYPSAGGISPQGGRGIGGQPPSFSTAPPPTPAPPPAGPSQQPRPQRQYTGSAASSYAGPSGPMGPGRRNRIARQQRRYATNHPPTPGGWNQQPTLPNEATQYPPSPGGPVPDRFRRFEGRDSGYRSY